MNNTSLRLLNGLASQRTTRSNFQGLTFSATVTLFWQCYDGPHFLLFYLLTCMDFALQCLRVRVTPESISQSNIRVETSHYGGCSSVRYRTLQYTVPAQLHSGARKNVSPGRLCRWTTAGNFLSLLGLAGRLRRRRVVRYDHAGRWAATESLDLSLLSGVCVRVGGGEGLVRLICTAGLARSTSPGRICAAARPLPVAVSAPGGPVEGGAWVYFRWRSALGQGAGAGEGIWVGRDSRTRRLSCLWRPSPAAS